MRWTTRDRLRQYGGRVITIDGLPAVQMVSRATDNARRRFQYILVSGVVWRRVLDCKGHSLSDGSPWEPINPQDVSHIRGWHPIVDSLTELA